MTDAEFAARFRADRGVTDELWETTEEELRKSIMSAQRSDLGVAADLLRAEARTAQAVEAARAEGRAEGEAIAAMQKVSLQPARLSVYTAEYTQHCSE